MQYRRMKVLQIIPVYEPAWQYGGPVRSVSQLCRELANLGLDITVYTSTANGNEDLPANIDSEIELGSVKVWRFPLNFHSNYFFSPLISKALEKNAQNFDLIHITSIWNYHGLPAARIARKKNIPYLYSVRGSLILENHPGILLNNLKKVVYYNLFLKGNFNHSAAVHYTNRMEYELSKKFYKKPIPGFIVPNGIDFEEFNQMPERADGLKRFGDLPANSMIISYLGRLHPRKGLEILIQAFKKVSSKFENAHLILAGPDYGSEASLRHLIEILKLQDRIHLTGLLSSKERLLLLAASNIFVLAGYAGENFGIAAVEAMAAGVPVIVSENVCIFPEIMEDKCGMLVSVNETSLADALVKLLSDNELRQEMAEAAYSSVRKRYDKKVTAATMAMAYESILSGKKRLADCWI